MLFICIIIGMQILFLDYGHNKYAILLQIILFSWVIRTIFIPNIGFFGQDSYREMEVVKVLIENGWSLESNVPANYQYQYSYPILYVLIIITSQITGVNIDSIARWLPLIYSTFSLLFIYLLTTHIYEHSPKSSLLTVFGASMLYQYIMFHTLPIRESISFVFFTATIYTFIKGKKSNVKLTVIALFFSLMITLSHHLTSFLIIFFWLLYVCINKLLKLLEELKFKKLYFHSDNIGYYFLSYTIVLIFGYWLSLRYSPMNIIVYAFEESAYKLPGHGMIVPNNLRYIILVNGEYIFALIFTVISIYSIMLNKKRTSFDLALFLWAVFMGMMAVLTLKGMVLRSESVAFASRFQTFGYMALFILSGYIISLKNQNDTKLGAKEIAIVSLYIIFVLFNIYRISADLYT